jgi:hypothetical protein
VGKKKRLIIFLKEPKFMPKSRKLTVMQIYPDDWLQDIGVRALSFHDQGVWFAMLMLMHESESRGKLMLRRKAMSNEQIARALRIPREQFETVLETLLETGVAEREKSTGALISRRMIREEKARENHRKRSERYRNNKKTNNVGDAHGDAPVTPLSEPSSPSISTSLSVSKQEQKKEQKQINLF